MELRLGAPDQESIDELLREHVGVEPGQLGTILELAALGVINLAWRNTAVENWHAQGRIHDGDLLRINSHSTWRLRQLLYRWRTEMGFNPDSPVAVLDEIDFDQFRWLGGRIHRWLVSPQRRLANGTTLSDLAGSDLSDLYRDADRAITDWFSLAEDHGVTFALGQIAAHGGMRCRHWWGHPAWPGHVGRFLSALDHPGDEHWGPGGEFRDRLPPEPPAVRDRDAFSLILLRRPWDLDSESALWAVNAGLKYLRLGPPPPSSSALLRYLYPGAGGR